MVGWYHGNCNCCGCGCESSTCPNCSERPPRYRIKINNEYPLTICGTCTSVSEDISDANCHDPTNYSRYKIRNLYGLYDVKSVSCYTCAYCNAEWSSCDGPSNGGPSKGVDVKYDIDANCNSLGAYNYSNDNTTADEHKTFAAIWWSETDETYYVVIWAYVSGNYEIFFVGSNDSICCGDLADPDIVDNDLTTCDATFSKSSLTDIPTCIDSLMPSSWNVAATGGKIDIIACDDARTCPGCYIEVDIQNTEICQQCFSSCDTSPNDCIYIPIDNANGTFSIPYSYSYNGYDDGSGNPRCAYHLCQDTGITGDEYEATMTYTTSWYPGYTFTYTTTGCFNCDEDGDVIRSYPVYLYISVTLTRLGDESWEVTNLEYGYYCSTLVPGNGRYLCGAELSAANGPYALDTWYDNQLDDCDDCTSGSGYPYYIDCVRSLFAGGQIKIRLVETTGV